MTSKRGDELQVGDVIEVWWGVHRDMIVELVPYHGPHEKLGCIALARFAVSKVGMSIFASDWFDVENHLP